MHAYDAFSRATRLVKSQQSAGKEYVAVARFHSKPESKAKVARVSSKVRCKHGRPPASHID